MKYIKFAKSYKSLAKKKYRFFQEKKFKNKYKFSQERKV
jgi:hypothetical protein